MAQLSEYQRWAPFFAWDPPSVSLTCYGVLRRRDAVLQRRTESDVSAECRAAPKVSGHGVHRRERAIAELAGRARDANDDSKSS